jgi:hypothetical protein
VTAPVESVSWPFGVSEGVGEEVFSVQCVRVQFGEAGWGIFLGGQCKTIDDETVMRRYQILTVAYLPFMP